MKLKDRLNFTKEPVFLMDGSAFIYRSFYANRHLKRTDGFPTNAIVLTTRLLLKILRQEQPKYMLFCMDGKGKNFRHEIYPEYKANRPPMPEELSMQIEPVLQMVRALGIPLEIAKNCEADDCMASLAKRFSSDRPVILISGDKDLKQCLNNNAIMWDPASKDEKILTKDEFEAETGVAPANWPDVQAVIGDTADHIPGVPGIGPKTAMQIFAQYPSLEEIKKHINELAPKLRDKILPHMEEMFRWRKLTTLKTDVCENLSLDDLRIKKINSQDGQQIAKNFEMATIAKEILNLDLNERKDSILQELPLKPDDNVQKLISGKEPKKLADPALLPDCGGKTVAVLKFGKEHQAEIAIGTDESFQWGGALSALCDWLSHAEKYVIPELKDLIRNSSSFAHLLDKKNIKDFFDPSLASYLLDPESGDYSWQRLAAKWRGETDNSESADAEIALSLADNLKQKLVSGKLFELFNTIEMPLVQVLVKMEERGVYIDPEAFQKFLYEVNNKLEELTKEIFQEAGCEFNIRSSRQLGEVLLNNLNLTTGKKTKTGQISTSQANLEKLAGTNPIIDKILAYRKLAKLQATYLDPLPRLMDEHNRLHSTFNQMATATGRISSSNPNLQNIPVRGEDGKRMRACFVAPPNKLLLACDYSQIELRVLAHLSGDETLLTAFRKGEDIHTHTAALIFEKDPGEISSDQRRMAKTINFGLLYGMGARKLAQELKITEKQAVEFIDRYFAGLGRLKQFYDEIVRNAVENGFVSTMAGRIRWAQDIASANNQLASQAKRQAVNAVIQGSAADIIKLAMIAVSNDSELKNWNAELILQVHDELLLEAPKEYAEKACRKVVKIMESVKPGGNSLSIPLAVDWGIGENWAIAH